METEQQFSFLPPAKAPEATEPTAAQNRRLLAYLREHASINPMEAWTALGIYRLGARIFELREAGHDISTERIEVTNRFGEKAFVASYSLALVSGIENR